jgi:VWFA-related protein
MRFMLIGALIVTLLALVVTAGTAQDAVFRTSVDVVTVDAIVLDGNGRPLDDIKPEDFVVRVDGQARRVVSSQFIAQPASSRRVAPLAARHFTSNESMDTGRFVVLAVDEAHIRRTEGRPALDAAARFLNTLDPLDLVAVAPLSRVGVVEFTRDRLNSKRQVERLTGHTDPVFLQFNIGLLEAVEIADGSRSRLADAVQRECGRSLAEYINPNRAVNDTRGGRDACPEQLEQEARAMAQHARTQARISLDGLQALVGGLRAMPGSKTVVLLSEGMVFDPRLIDLSEFAALAKDARVALYVLHMEAPLFEAAQDRVSPTLLRDVQLRGDGLSRLASAARGAVFRLVGGDARPFDRIAAEISGYYLLAFEATDADRDGRVHKIDVALARGKGDVRARTAFRMPVVKPSPRALEDDLVRLLRSSRAATELPVRVATYTYAEPAASRLRIVVSTEVDAASSAPAAGRFSGSQVLLGFVLTDAKGVIAASGAHVARGGRHAFSTTVEPGPYKLRVAAIDMLAREGLVERPFTASLAAETAVRVSDLMLAPEPAAPTDPLQPFVDEVTAARVVAYVELYGDPAALDDARVTIAVTPDGSEQDALAVVADVRRQDTGMAVARIAVALDGVTRGRYVASARIAVRGEAEYRVARPFTYEP